MPEEEEGAWWRSFRARMQNGEQSFNHSSHTNGTLMKAAGKSLMMTCCFGGSAQVWGLGFDNVNVGQRND